MNLCHFSAFISRTFGVAIFGSLAQLAIAPPSLAIELDLSAFNSVGDVEAIGNAANLSNNSLFNDDAPDPDSNFNFSGNPAVPENTLTSALPQFNSGDLDGSNPLGFDAVEEGSAIQNTVTVNAGDVLSFDWRFLTNEDPAQIDPSDPFSNDIGDYAFIAIDGNIDQRIEVKDNEGVFTASGTNYDLEVSGRFSRTFMSDQTIDLSIGVVDIRDPFDSSAFQVSNAAIQPIPFGISTNQSAVVLFGGVGLILWRRHRRHSQRSK